MVSRGFHFKWTGSKQITPKNSLLKEAVKSDIGSEADTLSLTEELTESIHFSFFAKDLNRLLNSLKTRAALKIQRWFRNHLLKIRNTKLQQRLSKIPTNTLLEVIKEVKIFTLFVKNSVKTIQKFWRNRRIKRSDSTKSFPLRKLLAQTVSVGSKLRRINSMIQTVSLNRTMASPESQSALTPDKRKLSILYNKRSKLELHKRTSSLPDILKEILNDDANLSNETIPEIPMAVYASLPEISCVQKERKSLLVRKQSFKVRTRKVKKMGFNELNQALLVDEFRFSAFLVDQLNTIVPRLAQNSKFFSELEFKKAKEQLEEAYIELVRDPLFS